VAAYTTGGLHIVDNYIIRVYRCEKDNPRMFVGTVEEVGLKDKRAFTNYDELWEILNPAMKNGDAKAERREKA